MPTSVRVLIRPMAALGGLGLITGVVAAPANGAQPPGSAAAVSAPTASARAGQATPDVPSAFTDVAGRVVSVTSGFAQDRPGRRQDVPRSSVRVSRNGTLVLRMRNVARADVTRADYHRFETRNEARAWASLGWRPVGVVHAVTRTGAQTQVPVVFRSFRMSGSTAIVRARPQGGSIAPIAAAYVPHLASVPQGALAAGQYDQVAVTGWQIGSRMWRWGSTGSGTVSIRGRQATVSFRPSTPRPEGIQPSGQAASTSWQHLADQWSQYAGTGARARVAVTGAQVRANGSRVAENGTYLIRSVSYSEGLVTISARVPRKARGALRAVDPRGSQVAMNVALETPAGGTTTTYVVVAGDSIASGEGARYGGTYINPALQVSSSGSGTPTAEDIANRMKLFCDSVDLACTEATVGADGKVTYVADPGLVYEEGSWEDTATGQACHRSKTAPGTWLARYYSTQLGLDVEPITLACSGATTDNIIDTPFKGEEPQSQDLAALAAWVPVSHVVATIGANDIRFGEIATACLLAPVNALLGGDEPTGDIDPIEVLAGISRIFDDVRRGADGSVQSINPAFDPANLCSETQRPIVRQAVAEVRGKVTRAMQALHEAAPDADVVLTNYPSLVPASTHTYFPRQEWFDNSFRPVVLSNGPDGAGEPDCSVDPRPEECGDPGEYLAPWRVALENAGASYWPSPDFFDSDPRAEEPFVDGVLGGNVMNRLIAQNIYPGSTTESGQELLSNDFGDQVIQSWGFSITPLANVLGYGATQFGFDQDWASKEVVPSLNRAVVAGLKDADPSGAWSTPVDMTQVLNGRELGGKYVGHQVGPFDAVWKVDTSSYPPPTLGAGPTASRAQMVTNVFSGQQVPFVCPGPESVAGATGPECVGDLQEALHPNWRGQAAQGQCIVAVVTGAFGESGNACVRSIGDGTTTGRAYAGTVDDLVDPTLFTDVPGEDTLCLTDLGSAYSTESGEYQPCSSSVPADPTWDTERWEQGKVRWNGEKVTWR